MIKGVVARATRVAVVSTPDPQHAESLKFADDRDRYKLEENSGACGLERGVGVVGGQHPGVASPALTARSFRRAG
jgi:hypothetical protein